MLPQQFTGLLRRKGATRFYMWLVFSHTPLALFWRLAVLPHGVTARQRAECEGFDLTVSPSGALRHLPHWGRHLTLPLPFVNKRKRKPIANAVFNMQLLNNREPLKTGVKSKNGQGVPDSRKADEVRLYALRGGLTTKMARTAHFRSHEVFRGDQ